MLAIWFLQLCPAGADASEVNGRINRAALEYPQ